MSKRAEERALEAYPTLEQAVFDEMYPRLLFTRNTERSAFVRGYEQAEKDIKEWVEEQLTILDKQTLLHPDDDVFWAQRNLFKEMKDKLNSL